MALSAFDDKSRLPLEDDVSAMLGKTYSLWSDLQERIVSRFAPIEVEWGYAGKSTGWGLRLKRKKRVVVYMTPCKGYFLASFALGEKAVAAAHQSRLPASVLEIIDSAPKYAEGRGVRLEIRKVADVKAVEALAIIKMAN